MDSIEKLKSEIVKLQNVATENSYYPSLSAFLKDFCEEVNYPYEVNPIVVASLKLNDANIGFPDFTLQAKRFIWNTIGWIEVKPPHEQLNNPKFNEQFNRYRTSLPNVLFTNLREWQLYQWDNKDKPILVKQVFFDVQQYNSTLQTKEIKELLTLFLHGKSLQITTPKKLAISLARRAKLLSQQIEEALNEEVEMKSTHNYLRDLKMSFEKTLIDNMSPHQFANVVAETLTYSLFLASLEFRKKNTKGKFNITTATEFLPKNIPVLRQLYQLAINASERHDTIKYAIQSIVEQLETADINKIYSTLSSHKEDEDPVIYFYEPFLTEYDKDEKEKRGVFYTPKPIVDFIVKGVDHLLTEKFDKRNGLAYYSADNPKDTVQILDPATGTGTFLMSSLQLIYEKNKNLKSLGEHIYKKVFTQVIREHFLKHFYAFELMVAPYTIAHLKLTLELERLGFSFDETANDGDIDNDRLKIYLANTLDDPDRPFERLPLLDSISEEAEKAVEVKKNIPILSIIGNPPYSVRSANKGGWIMNLIENYKQDVKDEKNILPLSDDYIKFIRFSEWKINEVGQGIVAMITNHSFINGIIHRAMRNKLMRTFDQIYILDLHGNKTAGEVNPNPGDDQNVFPIMQGVCIFFFVKTKIPMDRKVWHSELWGSRNYKLDYLKGHNISNVKWKEIAPVSPNFYFVPTNNELDKEYNEFIPIKEIFKKFTSGVKTHHDNELVSFRPFNLDTNKHYSYRPYDIRFINYDLKKVERHRYDVMKNMLANNIGIILMRKLIPTNFTQIFVTKNLMDINFYAYQSYMFPLYLVDELPGTNNNHLNINKEVIDKFGELYGEEISGEELFSYVYAILHSDNYRQKYKEQLKAEFPKIPLLKDKTTFKKLAENGNILINLHLLDESHINKVDTILNHSDDWNLSFEVNSENSIDENMKFIITDIKYSPVDHTIFINENVFIKGIIPEVWNYKVGSYFVLNRWLSERKKHKIALSSEEILHFFKSAVAIKETLRITKEIDSLITFPIS